MILCIITCLENKVEMAGPHSKRKTTDGPSEQLNSNPGKEQGVDGVTTLSTTQELMV